MANDLISRNALMQEIEKSMNNNPHTEPKVKVNHEQEHKHFMCLLSKQPTAYDVEKVVECLEEKVELAHKRYVDCPVNSPCYERYRTQYNERRMCLDIVEGGGVNDD